MRATDNPLAFSQLQGHIRQKRRVCGIERHAGESQIDVLAEGRIDN